VTDAVRRVVFGCLLLAIAVVGLVRDVPWVAESFYAWAWWGWILLLDAFCIARRGSSLLSTRRKLALPIAISSVSFWFVFEALNLRFQNWYYVGAFHLGRPADVAACAVFTVTAFATVFVGIFETIDALGASGLWRRWRGRPRELPSWLPAAIQALGFAMAAAAILLPTWLSPLIWGSFSFLIDPWNYRRGRRSLLADVEAGEYGRLGRILLGGLVCGLVWESLNFIAPQKWIYTVRGLEDVKLFEMPLLGFLGFPALALDSVTAFAVLSNWIFANETWEHPDDAGGVTAPGHDRRRGFYRSIPLQVACWFVICLGVIDVNVGSRVFEIDALHTLDEEPTRVLRERGLSRPRALRKALRGEHRAELLAATGLDEESARAVEDELELYLFKGIGHRYGGLLRDVGIERVDDLSAYDPAELHALLEARAHAIGQEAPRLAWVDVWVRASRDRDAWSVT